MSDFHRSSRERAPLFRVLRRRKRAPTNRSARAGKIQTGRKRKRLDILVLHVRRISRGVRNVETKKTWNSLISCLHTRY